MDIKDYESFTQLLKDKGWEIKNKWGRKDCAPNTLDIVFTTPKGVEKRLWFYREENESFQDLYIKKVKDTDWVEETINHIRYFEPYKDGKSTHDCDGGEGNWFNNGGLIQQVEDDIKTYKDQLGKTLTELNWQNERGL